MADRVVVMQGGRIEQLGAPLELYDRPVNLFVAGFMGSPAMNQIAGHVVVGPDGPAFQTDAGLRFALPAQALPAEGRRVVMGIRPEHLAIDGTDPALTATVAVVEASGADTLLILREAGLSLTVLVRDRVDAGPGARVGLTLIPGKLHFFDAESGARIAPGTSLSPPG